MSKLRSTDTEKEKFNFPLKNLYIYLTEGCNLACAHCWLAPKLDADGSRYSLLPLQIFKKIIKEAMPLGLSSVKLTGGEPLLHPDFLLMLDILEQEKIYLVLETNGYLCTREIATRIAKLGKPFVSVSLDGADAETHDRIRGVKGSFLKATAAVELLAEMDLHPQVIMTLMQANVAQVEALIQLAETLGAGSVKFNIIQPTGRGKALRNGSNGLAVENLIQLGRRVESELAANSQIRLFFDYPAAFRSLRTLAVPDNCGVCGILTILGVLPSGHYALCGIGAHEKDLVFGKADDDALVEVWQNNPILEMLRSNLPHRLTGICARCLMKHQCLGACLAQNFYRTGSLLAPYWFCEQAATEGLFPDSRLDLSSQKTL